MDEIGDYLGIGAYLGDKNNVKFTTDKRDASAKLKFTTDIDLENGKLLDFNCKSPQGTTFLRTGEHAVAQAEKNTILDLFLLLTHHKYKKMDLLLLKIHKVFGT